MLTTLRWLVRVYPWRLLGWSLLGAFLCGFLTGCTMPAKVSEGEAADIVKAIRYVRDPRTGVCFATMSSASYSTYYVVSIAAVPDDACRKFGL